MRCLLPALLIATCLQGAQPRRISAPFRVFAGFESIPSAAVLNAVQTEIESIFAPAGWQVEWESLKNAGKSWSVSLAVVRFTGTCNSADLTPHSADLVTLGRAHLSEGSILSFADIFCDPIRWSVAVELAAVEPGLRDHWYGRAIGRVLAHELYHILTGEEGHDTRGLAKGRFGAGKLMAPDFRFEPGQVKKLRAKLVPVLLSAYSWPEAPGRGARMYISSGCSGCHGLIGEGTKLGPPLHEWKIPRNKDELLATLTRRSHMYRRARGLNALWPAIQPGDASVLLGYLKSLEDWSRNESTNTLSAAK